MSYATALHRSASRGHGGGQTQKANTTKKHSAADLRRNLDMLLSSEEGLAAVAQKLFKKFDGLPEQLPVVYELLETKWGVPINLFPCLSRQLRRVVFARRGEHLLVGSTAADSSDVANAMSHDASQRVLEEEWVCRWNENAVTWVPRVSPKILFISTDHGPMAPLGVGAFTIPPVGRSAC